ncbi:MAG: methionyl-tRNA formyltransferase [Bacteroidota bacterium]
MDSKKLRLIFMGTPGFAVESLKALVEGGYNVVAVITAPDKPAGRGQKLAESAVKTFAVQAGIPVLQPEKLKNPAFLEQLAAVKADLQIVVAFRMLPEVVWNMPSLGTFNLHASLLPAYRGAAPLNWAIINGEKETGVTTFLLSHEIDTGKVLFKEKTSIGDHETVGDLHDRLMVTGAQLVTRTVDALAAGSVNPIPQDELVKAGAEVRHAPKLFRETMKIDWTADASRVRNLIRGLSPYPGAWTTLVHNPDGRETELKIFFAELTDGPQATPGTLLSDGKSFIKVACGLGWLSITDLQLSGKKRMKTPEFLRGLQNLGEFQSLFYLSL